MKPFLTPKNKYLIALKSICGNTANGLTLNPNKKTMKKFLVIAFVLSVVVANAASDIHFSMFEHAPLTINPAQTGGFKGDFRAYANYKDQWRSVASPYKTICISGDAPLLRKKWKKGFIGVGGLIFNDRAGDAKVGTTNFNLALSSFVFTGPRSSVSGGLSAGYVLRSINPSALTWDNQYDPNAGAYNPALASGENFVTANYGFFDAGAGIAYHYGKGEMYSTANNKLRITIGAAYHHATLPKFSFLGDSKEKLYGKIIGHGSALIGIKNTNLSICPQLLYMRQGPVQEITPGVMFRYMVQEASHYTGFFKESAISLGGYMRVQDAAVFCLLYEFANYAAGISYDFNISKLRVASNMRGGLEIMLRYITPNPFGAPVKPRYDLNQFKIYTYNEKAHSLYGLFHLYLLIIQERYLALITST